MMPQIRWLGNDARRNVLLASRDDYKTVQEGLYDEFYTLTGHLLKMVESH